VNVQQKEMIESKAVDLRIRYLRREELPDNVRPAGTAVEGM